MPLRQAFACMSGFFVFSPEKLPTAIKPRKAKPHGAKPHGAIPREAIPHGAIPHGAIPRKAIPRKAIPHGAIPPAAGGKTGADLPVKCAEIMILDILVQYMV